MLTKATTWLRPRMGNGQPSRSLEAVDWTGALEKKVQEVARLDVINRF